MGDLGRYKKRPTSLITAVRLDLDTAGFSYHKWGGTQTCKPGDWLVDNDGDIYTVDDETFARTYRPVTPGRFAKTAVVWAEIADRDGVVTTKEGDTHYRRGDRLVYNAADRQDGYAMNADTFDELYEPAEADRSDGQGDTADADQDTR